jgi:hypothetical protein
MDSQGKLLWVRNPWEDARAFCPYRTPRPVVASLKAAELTELDWSNLKSIGGNPAHSFIAIKSDSSQFGVRRIDESTGDFFISSPEAKTDLAACCEPYARLCRFKSSMDFFIL